MSTNMFSTSTSSNSSANSNTNNNKKRKANSDTDGDDGGSIQVGQAAATAAAAAEAEAVGPIDTATITAEAATGSNDINKNTNTHTNNPSSQLSSLQSKMNEFIDTMKDSIQNAEIREEKSEQRAIKANKRSERLENLLKKAVKTTDKFLKDQQQQQQVVVLAAGASSVSSSSDEEGQQQQLPLLNVDVDAEATGTTYTTSEEEEEEIATAKATALAIALSNNCQAAEKAKPENIVLNSDTWSTMLQQLQDDGYNIQPISSTSNMNDDDNDDNDIVNDEKKEEENNYGDDDDEDNNDRNDNNNNNNNNASNSNKYADLENANDANNESKESLAAQQGRKKRNKYYTWERNYQNLRYYRIRYGHCNVPQRSPKNRKNDKLGKWVSNMRSAYTAQQKLTGKNITTKISKNQIDKLNSIGFHWSTKKYPEETINESWYSMYEQLEQYKQLTGNINVVLDPNNPSQLAKWCIYQENELLRLKQYKDTILTINQIKQLYTIGMV